MKTNKRIFLAILMSAVSLYGTAVNLSIPVLTTTVSAADMSDIDYSSLPTISSTQPLKCYPVSWPTDKKIKVYLDAGLAKVWSGHYISPGDYCEIIQFFPESMSIEVRYPSSRGMVTAYTSVKNFIPTETLEFQWAKTKAAGAIYKNPERTSRIGSISNGEVCCRFGNNYIVYKLDDNSGWKGGFVKFGATSVTSAESTIEEVENRLYKIKTGQVTYNKDTVLEEAKIYEGTFSSQECKGFARCMAILLWGHNLPLTKDHYLYQDSDYYTLVDSQTDLDAAKAELLFSNAKSGYIVQMQRRVSGGSHSAILYAVDACGVSFLEANAHGDMSIHHEFYSWEKLAEKNINMSVYRPNEYRLA